MAILKLLFIFSLIYIFYCEPSAISIEYSPNLESIASQIYSQTMQNVGHIEGHIVKTVVFDRSLVDRELCLRALPPELDSLHDFVELIPVASELRGFEIKTIKPSFWNLFGSNSYMLTGIETYYKEETDELMIFGIQVVYKNNDEASRMLNILSETSKVLGEVTKVYKSNQTFFSCIFGTIVSFML